MIEKVCPVCNKGFVCTLSCKNVYRNTDPHGCFCPTCLGVILQGWTWKDFVEYNKSRKECNLLSEEFWKTWKEYFITHWKFLP